MSGTNARVSVVIPCHNAAEYLEEAVASVWSQSVLPQEIVCVDDGSTDETLSLLTDLRERSTVPLHVLSGPNRGASSARNWGTRQATGEYVQYLDADDVLGPQKLERHVRLAEGGGGDMVAGAYASFPMEDPVRRKVFLPEQDPWVGLLTARLGITSSNLYRRTSIEAIGGWDESLSTSEDPDLAFRLLQNGAVVVPDLEVTTELRRRPDSLWNGDPIASTRGWLELRGRIVAVLRQKGELTEEREEAAANAAFARIRMMYKEDPQFACEMHEAIVSPRYALPPRRWSFVYRAAYATVGFRWTEALRSTLRRNWRPVSFGLKVASYVA